MTLSTIERILQFWIPPLISIPIMLFYTAGILFLFNYAMRSEVIINIAFVMMGIGFLSLAAHAYFRKY